MNAYPYIKNIDHEKVLKIADQVNADADQVVSKTLAQNDFVSVTLFAFSKGEDISTHDSIGDAMVTVIEGCGKFIVDDKEYIVNQGESLVMPAKKPHSVHAVEAFKMMLVVVFPLHQKSDRTDLLILQGLIDFSDMNLSDGTIQNTTFLIKSEKSKIAPMCETCAARWGKTWI